MRGSRGGGDRESGPPPSISQGMGFEMVKLSDPPWSKARPPPLPRENFLDLRMSAAENMDLKLKFGTS